MNLFEFISGMIGVLIALAIAQLLVSVGRLAQNHARVRTYLPHTLWIVAIFLISFLHWWTLWDFRDLAWNSAMFFFSLCGPLLLFFAVTLLSPEVRPGDEEVDLEKHYQDMRVLFLSVFFAALLFLVADGPLFGTEPFINSLRISQGLLFVFVTAALVSSRKVVQVISAALVVLVLATITVLRFFPGSTLS